MTDPIPIARSVLPRGRWSGPADHVRLTYDERFLRRRRLVAASGRAFLLDLPETVSLNPGDALALEDGGLVAIEAADEPLLEVRGAGLARLAWHIGNRHTPCQIEADRLLIRDDHVLADMLRRLGAELRPVTAPFLPEGGAYGHGRVLGHDHAGAHDHGEGHAHVHASRDGHVHPVRRVHSHVAHHPGEDDPGPADSPE